MKVQWQVSENRMGSSRLQQAADILGVTVPFFLKEQQQYVIRSNIAGC